MARDWKRHACGTGAPETATAAAAMSSDPALASTLPPPHPCLIQLVQLLARQAAAEEIARQRAAFPKGD